MTTVITMITGITMITEIITTTEIIMTAAVQTAVITTITATEEIHSTAQAVIIPHHRQKAAAKTATAAIIPHTETATAAIIPRTETAAPRTLRTLRKEATARRRREATPRQKARETVLQLQEVLSTSTDSFKQLYILQC